MTGSPVMLEQAARRTRSAVVLGHGGGSDCLVATLVGEWLRKLGLERVLIGGVACQWWGEPGAFPPGDLVEVLGPDLYDPHELDGARSLNEWAVLVGPEARLGDRVPHEATLAGHMGGEAFVISHRGGARGSTAGMAAVVAYADADLVVSVDVGSDTLSTGREVRPAQTALTDHLTLAALAGQRVPSYFALSGYGVDAEMELEELDRNFGQVVRAGGLRGAFAPSAEAIEDLELLHSRTADPVGSLVAKASRGEFGLHRVHKDSPWGAVARVGPASIPIWVMDPQVVIDEVATDVRLILDTTSLEEATGIYARAGRIPETRLARVVNYGRARTEALPRPEHVSSGSVLIRNGLVVTMDPKRLVLRTNVYIEGNRIAECPSGRTTADEVVDATDCLVIPGLIQTHVHLCQTLFRGLADDMDVVDWLRLRIWPFEQAHDAQSVYDSARLGIAEMLRGGTTTALTIETVRHTEEAFRAILETGFRAVSGKAMMDHFEVGTEMIGEDTDESMAESLRLLNEFHGAADGRLRYAFCPRGSRNVTEGLWKDVAAAADEHDAWIHTHAAENQAQTERLAVEGGTDVAYLAGLGVLGRRAVLAHCIWLTEEELRLLAETGANVAHCPTCNMKLASGFAPIPELLDLGVTVGVGADGAPCNNTLDMFQEMRMASLIHKPRVGPMGMPAQRVFEMATLGGARSIGQEHDLGSLEAGKLADVVVIRRDQLHVQPRDSVDPMTQLVYEHRASDVDTVIVDGRVLVRRGEFVAMDQEEIAHRASRSLARILGRTNRPEGP